MKRIQKIAALFLSFLLMTQLMLVPAVGEQTSNAAQSTEGSPTIQAPALEKEKLEPTPWARRSRHGERRESGIIIWETVYMRRL